MIQSKNKNSVKAKAEELKGDKFLKKGQDKKAFECYKKSLNLDEGRAEIYDKLISLHGKYTDDWNEKDFAYNIWLGMKKQEILDPAFKRIHARAEANSQKITNLIKTMFNTESETEETRVVEEIVTCGPDALYPLIDYILALKNLRQLTKNLKKG
jgi:hypothetical protein